MVTALLKGKELNFKADSSLFLHSVKNPRRELYMCIFELAPDLLSLEELIIYMLREREGLSKTNVDNVIKLLETSTQPIVYEAIDKAAQGKLETHDKGRFLRLLTALSEYGHLADREQIDAAALDAWLAEQYRQWAVMKSQVRVLLGNFL